VPFNGRFKPGIFFVWLIILWAKHELTSKAVSKTVFLRLLQVGSAIITKCSFGSLLKAEVKKAK